MKLPRPLPRVRRCAICGSTKGVEEHHLGGPNHAAFFKIPLCRSHHEAVTIAIHRAGVNMKYTSDKAERLRRARMAAYVFLWFIDEQLQPKRENQSHEKQ